ncbi:MAG: hypothetical protein PSX81_02510 [bacterium]|nr:hypothetical protein [bacterium]
MTTGKYPIAIAAAFIWIGFVCAISFMEAWLKFRAPGVSMSIGIGIGRLVFSALNKVEWVMILFITINFLLKKEFISGGTSLLFAILLLLLILQTFWLLPALDERAELQIISRVVVTSNLHFYYVGMEVIKVTLLAIFGILLLKKNQYEIRGNYKGY